MYYGIKMFHNIALVAFLACAAGIATTATAGGPTIELRTPPHMRVIVDIGDGKRLRSVVVHDDRGACVISVFNEDRRSAILVLVATATEGVSNLGILSLPGKVGRGIGNETLTHYFQRVQDEYCLPKLESPPFAGRGTFKMRKM